LKFSVSWICAFFVLAACAPEVGPVDYSERSIATLQQLMEEGELSSEELTAFYLQRIAAIDQAGPKLNAIIEVNPEALEIAKVLDEERQTSGPRGPMHGIPVVLKANIDTADKMSTTAGSLSFATTKASSFLPRPI
jgi:amidase